MNCPDRDEFGNGPEIWLAVLVAIVVLVARAFKLLAR